MSISLSLVTGINPVPKLTITVTGEISESRPTDLSARLYSWISVSASNVGLLAIRPPSKNLPKALKLWN